MKKLLQSVILSAIMIAALPLAAQESAERRANINAPVVGIMGAGLDGQMTKMLWDITNVTTSESMRVLPILGKGSINNVVDLLYLRGVDGAMVQSDALNFYESLGIETNLRNKIVYLAPLGRQVAHLLARMEIQSVDDLEGKKVNFGRTTSGSVVSAGQIFDQMSIVVEATNMGHRAALKAMKEGEIDAMFWMAPPPAELLLIVAPEDELHFLSIPASRVDTEVYPEMTLEAGTYPFQDEDVQTVSTMTVLAAYNWPKDNPRRAKVERFAASLHENFEKLRTGDYHPSFRTVVETEKVPGGWIPFN